MKVMLSSALWSIWLSGIALIAFSLYATQMLPQITRPIPSRRVGGGISETQRIIIFSAPRPFSDCVGDRQSLALRSWLALSPEIKVVLFSRDRSAVSAAGEFGSRVVVDPNIDFTFLGTPFFHSMMARTRSYSPDIYVLVDPETIVLPDFMSTLNYAYKLDHDWLLVASSRNVSHFSFYLDEEGKHWRKEGGKLMKPHKLQEIFAQNWQWIRCDQKLLLAWNSGDVPLYSGVLPPFLYGRGVHNSWIVNEALSSELRFVFDASWTVSSLYLIGQEHLTNWNVGASNASNFESMSWEYFGNSHVGALYGSLSHHETNYSSLLKLLKCNGKHVFVNTAEKPCQSAHRRAGLGSRWKKKSLAWVDGVKSQGLSLDCSLMAPTRRSNSLDYPFSLETLLPLLADKNRTIVLAAAGYSYKDMLMSWVCRMRYQQITNFIICALDQEIYEFSVLMGLPVFRDPVAPSEISFNDCHFGTKCFQKVTKVKSRMVLKILQMGYNVLLSDVDVYWFGNPLPLLWSYGPAVLAAQSDEFNKTGPINLPRRLNSGFYFARSDSSTIAAMKKVVAHAATSGLSEQPSFYDMLCGEGGSNRVGDHGCFEPETNLTVHFLDRDRFPNGAYLDLWQNKNVRAACAKLRCLVLHNNWISGRLKKLERQVLSGLWDYDPSTRLCQAQIAATLKMCMQLLGLARHADNDLKKNKLLRGDDPMQSQASFSADFSSQSKIFLVRIVHAGGKEELFPNAVPASLLMDKYPGKCVARPEVFKKPHESLLRSEESLLPGHKYYILPCTTAQKLKHKQQKKMKAKEPVEDKERILDSMLTEDSESQDKDDSICSASDFVSKERRSKSSRRRAIRAKTPFVPPLPKVRSCRRLGWEPSLTSVQEVSP